VALLHCVVAYHPPRSPTTTPMSDVISVPGSVASSSGATAGRSAPKEAAAATEAGARSTSRPTSTSSDGKKQREEDQSAVRLRRAWRSFSSSLVVAARAAEKVAKNSTGGDNPSTTGSVAKDKKDMNDALETTLRFRGELIRQTALCEAKLRGNAKETEALECSMRSQPSIGVKRKRDKLSSKEFI